MLKTASCPDRSVVTGSSSLDTVSPTTSISTSPAGAQASLGSAPASQAGPVGGQAGTGQGKCYARLHLSLDLLRYFIFF